MATTGMAASVLTGLFSGLLGAQNTVMLSAPALTSAPLAAVASVSGLPVPGAVVAALVGLTALAAVIAPAFRGIDDLGSEQEDREEGEAEPDTSSGQA